jgi:protein-tyrosine phosphatase
MFEHFMDFVDRHIQDRLVIVHCRAGLSRSPSLVLLWLAKRTDVIPATSYLEAAEAFSARFRYAPRAGIAIWLRDNWRRIP